MFVRVKKIGGYEYLYLVENVREGGRHVALPAGALRRDGVEQVEAGEAHHLAVAAALHEQIEEALGRQRDTGAALEETAALDGEDPAGGDATTSVVGSRLSTPPDCDHFSTRVWIVASLSSSLRKVRVPAAWAGAVMPSSRATKRARMRVMRAPTK